MQSATTKPAAPADETVLTIRVSRREDRFIAHWSAEWIGGHGFSGTTADGVIKTVLDSIWQEGTRRRGRGRPSRRSRKMERLVRSRVRVVIEIESGAIASLRSSPPSVSSGSIPPLLSPTSSSGSVH
jgi:hypothetical protein